MVHVSRLASKQDIRNVLLMAQEFISTVKNSQVKVNLRSKPVVLFLTTLVTTFGLGIVFSIRSLVYQYKEYQLNKKINRPALIRQSSTILKNGSREIIIPKYSDAKASGNTRIIIPKPNLDQYAADKYLYKNYYIEEKLRVSSNIINSKFINQLVIIWRILVPKFYTKNTYLLFCQCFFLVLRTWLSLLIAKLDGQIVKNLISGNGKKFVRDLIYWILIAFPASYTNAAIKYLTNRLSLSFRSNLTRYIHDLYLDKVISYYKINNFIDIQNIDQYITNDVSKFCDSICSLFSNMGKPMIDLVFFSIYLRDNLGTGAILGIFANYFLTAYVLKLNTPKFGKLSAQETELEGKYYNEHLNLITNCEEIGFYKGSVIEKSKLNETFVKLTDHINKTINISFSYSILEDYILKYTWSAWGYVFAGLPVFIEDLFPTKVEDHVDNSKMERKNMRQFIINKRLMLSLADAGSRLMYSIKDVAELTGYTDRVFQLLSNLHLSHSPKFNYGSKYPYDQDIRGTIQKNYSKGIRFENIPLIVPSQQGSTNDKLIHRDLTFEVHHKQNLLILGSNGSGKTSIARILAELWPVYSGLLSKPNDDDIFYLPQKPYFTKGTLRDQIIYPYSYNDMIEQGYNDDHLYHILVEVKLDYLLKREGNFNVEKDWKDVFSGGEKQRISIARVLFKAPKFVILDESTNAVSTDVEDYLFELLQKKDLTFITLSHRPLLMKYHDYVLEIGDDGDYQFHDLTSEENLLSMDKEIKEIEEKLSKVEEWEARLGEIELYLDGKGTI